MGGAERNSESDGFFLLLSFDGIPTHEQGTFALRPEDEMAEDEGTGEEDHEEQLPQTGQTGSGRHLPEDPSLLTLPARPPLGMQSAVLGEGLGMGRREERRSGGAEQEEGTGLLHLLLLLLLLRLRQTSPGGQRAVEDSVIPTDSAGGEGCEKDSLSAPVGAEREEEESAGRQHGTERLAGCGGVCVSCVR